MSPVDGEWSCNTEEVLEACQVMCKGRLLRFLCIYYYCASAPGLFGTKYGGEERRWRGAGREWEREPVWQDMKVQAITKADATAMLKPTGFDERSQLAVQAARKLQQMVLAHRLLLIQPLA